MPGRKQPRREQTLGRKATRHVRCAIYTRKSTNEGLEQEFTTLDAQRQSGEDYVRSHAGEGWEVVSTRYDDGGFSGADMNRPAFQRLLADARSGSVDAIVVYKLDRLTRSLRDFGEIVDVLDRHGVALVAVTQPLDTSTSVGRLTLNMLLSFAQFERELISERTRDKMAAARRKGKWTGGNLVLGYDISPAGGALTVNEIEADRVRQIFRLYLDHAALRPVVGELNHRGWTAKSWTTRSGQPTGGKPFTKNRLYNLLTNVIYTGKVAYAGDLIDGEHAAIIDADLWRKVQARLRENSRTGGRLVRNKHSAVLKGILRCASCDSPMTHTYTKKGARLYRYYTCMKAHQRGWNTCATRSVSAPEIEQAVVKEIRAIAANPAVMLRVLAQVNQSAPGTQRHRNNNTNANVGPTEVADALRSFDLLWTNMTAHQQQTLMRTLVEQVRYDGSCGDVTVMFRSEACKTLCNPTLNTQEEVKLGQQ